MSLVCWKLDIPNKSSSKNKTKQNIQKHFKIFPKANQAFGKISLKERGETACEHILTVGEEKITPEAEFLSYCIAKSFWVPFDTHNN